MPITLPKSYTIDLLFDSDGQKEKIPLNTVIAEIAPNLCGPTILETITNTSAIDTSNFADVEYRALAKTKPTVTYKNGKYVTDPKNLTYKTMEVKPVRLSPIEIADKFSLRGIDRKADPNWERLLATNIVNFTQEIKMNNEILAFNNLAYAAQQTQANIIKTDSGATTFKLGAHVEKKNLNNADDVYNALSQAKTVIKNIGKANALTTYDKNFKYANGIDLNDVVCLMSDEVLDLLLSKPGVFASDAGLEVFKNLKIRNILGVNVIPTSNLPIGVNFLMLTVGKMGALAFNKIGVGDWFKFSESPDWELDTRLHCARQQVLGVVYESLIIGSFNADCTIDYLDSYMAAKESARTVIGSETFDLNDKSQMKKAVKAAKENIKQQFKDAQNQDNSVDNSNDNNEDQVDNTTTKQ